MNGKKAFSLFWSCLLAFCLSFGAIACLVTGFSMSVELSTVAIWCAGATLFCGICYSLPLGLLPIATFTLVTVVLLWAGVLGTSFECIFYRLSRQYDRAYGWGILKMNYLTADDMELQLWLGLCILGVLIAMATSWSVCHRKRVAIPMVLSSLPVVACLVVTDTVPAGWCLFAFLFAMVMLLFTGPVRRQDETRGNQAALCLVAPLAVLLLVLFLCIPQNNYTGSEAPRKVVDKLLSSEIMEKLLGSGAEEGVTGTSVDSGIVNLKTVGVRLESRAEVMQVLTDYDGTLYLRGRALDRYDGTTWTDSGVRTSDLKWPESSQLGEGGEVMITTRYAHRMLYLPYYVSSRDLTDMTRGLENTKQLTQYSFSCDVLSVTNDHYKIYTNALFDNTWDASFYRYLHLSEDVWAWAEPLALEITAGEETTFGKAQAIAAYVRNSATYNTKTYRMPSGSNDFAKWFLEESDTGYCVHFATTATVLLQAAGIPARYVTGYMVEAKAAYPVVVRSDDAHAWAEFWLPGFGWMVLEATPGAYEEPAPVEKPVATEPTEPDATQEATEPTQVTKPKPEKPQRTPIRIPTGVIIGILSVLALAAVIVQRIIRLKRRRARLAEGDHNRQGLRCWQELARMYKLLKEPADEQLHQLAQKAKFSSHRLTEEELNSLRQALSETEARLKKKSIFHQIYYRLILVIY